MVGILLDILHIIIGLIFIGLIMWIFIKIHLYFSQNNRSIDEIMNKT